MVAHTGPGNLYLADTNQYYEMDLIRAHFDLIPTGPIYQLQPR